MSQAQQVEGNRVYCYQCNHEWDRAHGGLQCPACDSEFVEIIELPSRSIPASPPPIPPHPRSARSPLRSPSHRASNPFETHNPWAPDPEEDDITTFEFNTGGGRGTFSFSTRTYAVGGGSMRTSRDVAADEIGRNFEVMLSNIMGFHPPRSSTTSGAFMFPQDRTQRVFGTSTHQPPQPPNLFSMLFQAPGHQQNTNQAPNPFDLLSAMFNPANARHGDAVFSQEAFDRVMTQLMEQNTSSAPGPASDAAIASLKREPVNESMLGNDGKAECSICMDNVQLEEQVTFLPCNHWFHEDCIVSWLREHDTCPHCRQPIGSSQNSTQPSESTRRRRSSRRSSSFANSREQGGNSPSHAENSSGLRNARQRYYSGTQPTGASESLPSNERRGSERSQRDAENEGGLAGGVANWIRNRLPFSGQQQ